MKVTFPLRAMALCSLMSGLLVGLHAPSASAVVQELTAEFVPDPSNPLLNKFVNTTPQSGVCATYMAAPCKVRGIFSLRVNGLQFRSTQAIPARHADPRQGVTFSVPSSWRPVEVVHSRTGETETVEMRVVGVGGTWYSSYPPGVSAWATAPGQNWYRPWQYPPAPCTGVPSYWAGTWFAYFFWMFPEGAGACAIQPYLDIPWFQHRQVDYAYDLRTPNPLRMSSGEYKGSLTYTTGPGGDFDFGDVMLPNDPAITLNFTLNVMHALKVEIPPGGNRIDLLPQGGWQAWLNQGRKPVRLFRDQTFNVSSSSRF
ncbi:MAG: hypothetical protein ACRESJ_19295, partial [Pseudomonas sp.]